MRVAPEHRDRFLAAVAQITRATSAETGNQEYAFYQSVDSGEEFLLVERWDDQDALEAHFRTEHLEAFRVVMSEVVTDHDTQVFDASGPRALTLPPPQI
jgi:quinol monooxygenase YgiN